jgi:nucleoside phosphorylase
MDINKNYQMASSRYNPLVGMIRVQTEEENNLIVHYGLILTPDRLMKDTTVQDALAAEEKMLCFEMEVARLMENSPCLVIRGICDYLET